MKLQLINKYGVYNTLGKYESIERFISYYNQIHLIKKVNPGNILEIGIGTKVVSEYFKRLNFDITTCDFDKALKPDIVADIRYLPFKDNQFDGVLAFEILEHLPFSDFMRTLKELKRVSKKYVIISIPYVTINISGHFKIIPYKESFNFLWRVMESFFIKHKFNGHHYWEMGKKDYSRKRIRKIIVKSGFRIKEEFSCNLNPLHYFFILKK